MHGQYSTEKCTTDPTTAKINCVSWCIKDETEDEYKTMSASKSNEVSTDEMNVNETTTVKKTSATAINPMYPVINLRGDRGGMEDTKTYDNEDDEVFYDAYEYESTDEDTTASSTPIKGSSRTGSVSNGQTNDEKLFGHAGSTVMGDPTGQITATNRVTRGTQVSRTTRGAWIGRGTGVLSPITTGTKSG